VVELDLYGFLGDVTVPFSTKDVPLFYKQIVMTCGLLNTLIKREWDEGLCIRYSVPSEGSQLIKLQMISLAKNPEN
jgi:hypothetical protein